MKYLVVALIKASDNTKGKMTKKVESFQSAMKVMQVMHDFVKMQEGEILSIYIKNIFNVED